MLFPDVEILALLFLAAFVAGFIDSIAGGGGLIAVPALLLAGIPPLETLATNKLQSLFGSGSAAINYSRRGHVNLRRQVFPAALSALASGAGALTATYVPADFFSAVLPFMLIAIALYFWLKPGLSDEDKAARVPLSILVLTAVPAIGFYDGIFGPGTGSFFMLVLVLLAGQGILKATAHTKVLNFASNIGAFAVFASLGAVHWGVGLVMGAAQILGALSGSHFAMKNGTRIIKPLLVCICIAMALKLWMQ